MTFLTSLDVRVLDDCGPRPRLMTLAPFIYEWSSGRVEVPPLFSFDGATIPTIGMGVVGWPAVRAACLHDYLLDNNVERRKAAHVFREALRACGVEESMVDILYQAVRMYDRIVDHKRDDSEPVGA